MKGFISTLVLSLNAVLALPAAASSLPLDSYGYQIDRDTDILSHNAKLNKNLDGGDYVFAGVHTGYSSSFLDTWKFTLAESSDVTISLFDLTFPTVGPENFFLGADSRNSGYNKKGGHNYPLSGPLIDNKYLTVSLFDHNGLLLGTAGENGSLTALNLVAGEWYTLGVSGKVNGLLGGVYNGRLSIDPVTAVPLGDSLPLFGTALLTLALQRKRLRSKEKERTSA